MATEQPADRAERWPVERSEDHYRGGWVVALREDQVRRPDHPDDQPFGRLVLEHPGSAVVLAVDDRGRVLCVSQYRHAVGQTLVQLPAGLCDVADEAPLTVAQRELVEEAGLEAADWTPLVAAYSSPGISAERTYYFLARDLTEVGRDGFEPEHEEAEMVTSWVAAADLWAAIEQHRIADAHLILALLIARSSGLIRW